MIFKPPAAGDLPPLTAEELSRPYAAWYWKGAAEPDAETAALIVEGRPLAVSDVLRPEDINRLMEPGYLPGEMGYCVLPDGTGYAAVRTGMPGISPEMLGWWTQWHEQEDLRYKLWCPGSHEAVGPFWMRENVGMGMEDIFCVQYHTPESFGFDMSRFGQNGNMMLAFGANGMSCPVGAAARPLPVTVMHFVRPLPGGLELRSRFWLGLHIRDGRAARYLLEHPVEEARACGFAWHCACEMATLRRMLPTLYSEYR